jgi:D-3-phosphoglycerate dehydrogenase
MTRGATPNKSQNLTHLHSFTSKTSSAKSWLLKRKISVNLRIGLRELFRTASAYRPLQLSIPRHPALVGHLKPFDTQDIKILLLENVNQSGRDILASQGYQVEALKTSLPEDQLIEKIRWDHPLTKIIAA